MTYDLKLYCNKLIKFSPILKIKDKTLITSFGNEEQTFFQIKNFHLFWELINIQ